jgi:ATP-binding cassette subfamily C (CFTR/MRP) protein 4
MVFKLTNAPISYFDTTPSGRIINRFSNDLSLADTIV